MATAKEEHVRLHCGRNFGILELNIQREMIYKMYQQFFLQFALGWWVVIDACAEYSEPKTAAYHICGIFSTIALVM